MNSAMEQDREVIAWDRGSAERSDEELLLDYRHGGDPEAFEELVRRYERELYNYLRQYLGDAQMAEDAFQTTFLQVHLKCDMFEEGRKVRPWLYTVATNQAIDAQRRNRRHRMVSLDRHYGAGGEEEFGALVELLDSDMPSPHKQADSAERGEVVREAIDQLPKTLQQVIMLVYYQGLKYREAAEILSIPVGTVKSRLHAAVHKLNVVLTDTSLSSHD